MSKLTSAALSRVCLFALVMISGVAALSWEIIWQIKASLALGVSAWGTALTLAVTMGGMSIGAFLMGHALKDKSITRPIRIYGMLEVIIGIAGLFLGVAFQAVQNLDSWVYATSPDNAPFIHILGIVIALGIPTIAMGATLPVFGLVARQFKTSIAVLYGLNTLGAACGVLLSAFLFIPQFGVTQTALIIATINIVVGFLTWQLGSNEAVSAEYKDEAKLQPQFGPTTEQLIVLITGFATFVLEVAWFRSLTAAFHSTTDAFATMLASVLIALGVAARLVPIFKKKKIPLGSLMWGAGVLILLATPLVERLDLLTLHQHSDGNQAAAAMAAASVAPPSYLQFGIARFIITFILIGPSVLLLGAAFPWIIDERHKPRQWGMLYAFNTLAAIMGSIGAAWLFLPTVGFARTAWLAGALVAIAGIALAPRDKRVAGAALGIMALLIAVNFESGIGKTRAQGHLNLAGDPTKILESYEGPESTVSAVEYENGGRGLVVDGFVAADQVGSENNYMAWMGHLPMLLHPDPKNALVICFGTGQTANAVRKEKPESLDIVDINPRVFKLAHNFSANYGVLNDPRVKPVVMDGRAYVRRTSKTYDIITLEPMPPSFAGVNALYSKEFYELARKKLGPDGVIAQWLPFHLVSPHYSASVARTFQSVFPNAILWADPTSRTGILLGTKNETTVLGTEWPGFQRTPITRYLSEDEVRKAAVLNPEQLRRYGENGDVISDDNQLLAYGNAIYSTFMPTNKLVKDNFLILEHIAKQAP